jgi:flagellar biosynthesis protein FliQ
VEIPTRLALVAPTLVVGLSVGVLVAEGSRALFIGMVSGVALYALTVATAMFFRRRS